MDIAVIGTVLRLRIYRGSEKVKRNFLRTYVLEMRLRGREKIIDSSGRNRAESCFCLAGDARRNAKRRTDLFQEECRNIYNKNRDENGCGRAFHSFTHESEKNRMVYLNRL